MLKQSLFLMFLCLGGVLQAQDQHHTWFENAPLYVNPALAGGYEGTIRLSGVYRDQYRSVANGYRTFDLGVEYNLPWRPRKKDWISAGVSFASDRQGSLNPEDGNGIKTSRSRLGAAYHFALNKKATSDIALGVQFLSNSVSYISPSGSAPELLGRIDQDILDFVGSGGGTEEGSTDITGSYSDYVVGLVYTTTSKQGSMRFGLAGAHILSPDASVKGGANTERDKLPLRLTGVFQMKRMLDKRLSIEPAVLFQKQGPATDISLHGIMGYDMNKESLLRLLGGVGYRVGDAAQLLVGADWKDWRFGFAYDINISNLSTASNYNGGFELSVLKQFNIKKKPDVKPVIFCPRI